MNVTEERFVEVFNRIEEFIERRYALPVLIRDVTDPFTGDLDGSTIEVDYDQSCEDALFIVAHLFGHTVQWNTDAAARAIGSAQVVNPSEEFLEQLRQYERTACRYSLQLFHEAGVIDLDQWMADFAAWARHPDGDIPLFNDASLAAEITPDALLDRLREIGLEVEPSPPRGGRHRHCRR